MKLCPVCGKPVPPDRQKYCSRECYKVVNQEASRTKARKIRSQTNRGKYRICLGCNRRFWSGGLRRCGRCHHSGSTAEYDRTVRIAGLEHENLSFLGR